MVPIVDYPFDGLSLFVNNNRVLVKNRLKNRSKNPTRSDRLKRRFKTIHCFSPIFKLENS
jgi:hypothetical protein